MKHARGLIVAMTLLAATVGGVACSSSAIAGPHDFRRFASAKALWDARPFTDYTYEIRTSCFCPPEINAWTRVTVRNGVVVDAEGVDSHQHHEIRTYSYWVPVDSVFAHLFRAMADGGDADSWMAGIDVEYDAGLGYPTYIEYRSRPNVMDAGAAYYLRNVRSLD